MNDKLNLNDLDQISGGAVNSFGYWKHAVIVSSGDARDKICLYSAAGGSPESALFSLMPGEEIFVFSENSDAEWLRVKAHSVVIGYVQAKYVSLQ